jgi:hypothetical protein
MPSRATCRPRRADCRIGAGRPGPLQGRSRRGRRRAAPALHRTGIPAAVKRQNDH